VSDSTTNLQPFSTVCQRPITWLQQYRMARGKLSLCDGDPGLGKSLISLDLCARITSGRPFPDGSPAVDPANVIILSGEDSDDDTVLPRLRAMGADLNRVFQFNQEFMRKFGGFRLPSLCSSLELAIQETQAAFVVIDPVTAFFDTTINLHNDASVRRALTPLTNLARNQQCHVRMLRHLNKTGHFNAMYRGGGSIAFLAACRSAYLCARHPDDPLRCVMAETKNNLATRQPSLSYRIRLHESGYPGIEWLSESPLTADQLLLAAGMRPPLPGALDKARDFLHAFLEDGPQSTLDIWDAAEARGFARRTIERVPEDPRNGINRIKSGHEGRNLTYWYLKDQALPEGFVPPDPGQDAVEAALDAFQKMYPIDPFDPEVEEEPS
jgi:hypothetical protein